MTKTTSGSFIVWCTPFSNNGEYLNSDKPTYGGKPVCILQVETIHEDDNYRNCLMMFELIYKE